MNTFPYLIYRNGVFYFRRVVPLNLRSILGKSEMVLSLKTKDIKTARKAALEMSETLDSLKMALLVAH